MTELEQFIIRAKTAGYVGGPRSLRSDSTFRDGEYDYKDSYVGSSNFCGQEIVTYKDVPLWSMVYYGYILRPDRISPTDIGAFVQEALSTLYVKENRFLGGYRCSRGDLDYRDLNFGDYCHFNGIEKLFLRGELVYELQYAGGLLKTAPC